VTPEAVKRYARHLVLKEIGGRQVQFTNADIGKSKAGVMADHLPRLNPDVKTYAVQKRLADDNAKALIAGHDIVLSGVDNFEARFAINNACLALALPHVSGALGRFDGQVSTFDGGGKGPCYRCFVPEIPPQAESCAQAGIIGALAGIIGSFMALEVIKVLTGAGQPLAGRVWIYDGLRAVSRTVNLPRDEKCPDCGTA